MAERLRTLYKHLNPHTPVTEMLAFGMTNPVKAVANKSIYSGSPRRPNPRKHRFTNNRGRLTGEQRQSYEENGYVVIPGLVSQEKLDTYRRRFQDICDGLVEVPGMTVLRDISQLGVKKSERVINKVQDFIFDDVLFDYCRLPEILDYVESFCGPNIKAVHSMLISKPPDTGSLTSRHPLHQDLHYFPFRPADRIVCAWTAMETVNRRNGCLVALPGTHQGELLEHNYPDWEGGVNIMYHGVSGISNDDIGRRVYLEMEAGDTVFFHPVLIHGSGANRTNGFRKAISCHYAACECDYIEVKGTSQEIIANEILDAARKKGAFLDDVKYIFQFKSRLVRGQEVTL